MVSASRSVSSPSTSPPPPLPVSPIHYPKGWMTALCCVPCAPRPQWSRRRVCANQTSLKFMPNPKRQGVTRQLLWEEYAATHPAASYSYPQFCVLYREWRQHLKLSMRQTHVAGEKLFLDYCGPTVPVLDPTTGQLRDAQVYVAVMGASNYTFAEATWTQSLSDWTSSTARALTFFGGVPRLLIPDNLKAAVTKACRYEPTINQTYADLAAHYGCAVLPTRPYKPKDKAKVEVGVQVVERWIIARLRHETFCSLLSLNIAIRRLLESLNTRPFKRLPGTRHSQFELLDSPALAALPPQPYEYAEWKRARVNIDYHVEVERHFRERAAPARAS
ncbi:MAG: IS21 family transposase [Acidobacteriota bacterium]|nr:IS21 family transposase [Acidobacteriota bacterium]